MACHLVVKCPPDAHFRIPMEVISHLGTFCLLFYEHCELEHTDNRVGKYVVLDGALFLVNL